MRRTAGLSFALLAFAVPLLALVHMATVPHFYNFATGELEHAVAGASATSPLGNGISANDRETCRIFALFLNQAQMWTIALAVAALFIVLRAAERRRPQLALRSRKLTLALAPKNSPPTTA
jgi:hypothetical protein